MLDGHVSAGDILRMDVQQQSIEGRGAVREGRRGQIPSIQRFRQRIDLFGGNGKGLWRAALFRREQPRRFEQTLRIQTRGRG